MSDDTELDARLCAPLAPVEDAGFSAALAAGVARRRRIHRILAWGPPGAPFEAEPVPGGYCISGTWRFASGSQNATWLGAHMKVKGRKEIRTMLFPKSSVTMVDIWHTLGLRGTASNGGRLVIQRSPYGKSTAAQGVSDRLDDLRNSVYGVGAAKERRIEIEQVAVGQ